MSKWYESWWELRLKSAYDLVNPPPETGYGSKADSVRWSRMKNFPPTESEAQGPFADIIKSSAYDLIGTKTYTRDYQTELTPSMIAAGADSGMGCATAACQILNKSNIPWPKDKSGKPVETIDYIIDALEGRGEPGKLFSEHSEDFKPVGPGELARGDMLILDTEWGTPSEDMPNEVFLVSQQRWVEGGGMRPDKYKTHEYLGYQKHMAIITDIYEDGIEVVHDRGRDEPKTSKFYSFEMLVGNENKSGYFDRAYRYIPSMDNTAFKHLIYGSR